MRIAIWINDVADLSPAQTTALLASGALARGHEVWVVPVVSLGLNGRGAVIGAARRVSAELDAVALSALREQAPTELIHRELDAVWIRTNPGRDKRNAVAHDAALGLAELLVQRGVAVLNDPSGLRRSASKLYLASLPEAYRPRTAMSADPMALRRFVEEAEGPAVLKPLVGTRGEGVFKLTANDPNLSAILELLVRRGPVLAQDCVPGAEAGDLRLIVLEGRPLEVDGVVACVQRVPARGEFRSNVHLGGQPTKATPTAEQFAAGCAIGERLAACGILLAGLDLIGSRAVEVNVFSTGGLADASQFAQVDFIQPILRAFEARVSSPPVPSPDLT